MDESALVGLGSAADPAGQERALQYFEQLKSADDGWKLCMDSLATGVHQNNDHVKFFCFQVLEHYLKTKYVNASLADQETLRSLLVTWVQMQNVRGRGEKTFIRNKAAQIFSLVFIVDYPRRWPAFFSDLLQILNFGEGAVDMYLRTMMAIDSEVVDREIVHTLEETERNTMLKDTMRQQAVPQLVDSWLQIITTYENSNPELTCQCLEVIGAYVSWIDISLVANDNFVTILLRFMSNQLLRESACDCIHEIIIKGMDPVAKTKLIESFMSVLQSAGVFNLNDDEESDYLAKLSKLVNAVGLQLILAWQKLMKGNESNQASAIIPFEALEAKVPLMFLFLANEDDDVSGGVSKFAHDYITVLKTLPEMTAAQRQLVKDLLYVVVKKMKFDDSYSFDSEGEEEAMFQEYRKELKVIFNNLGALDGNLVLSSVQEILTQTLPQWQTMDFRDVEMAITLTYMLAEALPASLLEPMANNKGQYMAGGSVKIPALNDIMRLLVTSRVSCHQHSAVVLQFFETMVRYNKFFSQEPQYIPDVLMAFLDERGLHSRNQHLSSRTSYLFSRFVKNINKHHMQGYLEEILDRIHDLLTLHTPENGVQKHLSCDDQLFLYETAGILIVQSQFPAEKKQELMRQLLVPIVTKFDGILQALMSTQDETLQVAYAECLSQAMGFASRTSKGFSGQQTMKQCGCVEVYTELLRVFLLVLNAPVERPILHAGVRQFLHRMVVCLEEEILPFIPDAMNNLLDVADAKELHDFIPLLNQVISKFKTQITPFLMEVFMPVVSTIFRMLSAPIDERDQVAANDKKMLHRGYFSFIGAIVTNNVTEVLSTQDMQNVHEVLMTVIQGAVDIPDPTGQKACFAILKRLIEVWGSKEGGLVGFSDFMYKNIVPACFMAPLKPTFDLTDAQTILALNECGGCLMAAFNQRGEEFLYFLQSDYLPKLNLGPNLCVEFCQAFKSDHKVFKNYFKAFFVRAKS